MFCSQKCREEAFEMFHKFECPVMSKLLKSGSVNIALRIFFIALSACGSIDNLRSFMNEIESSPSNVFDFDFSDETDGKAIKNYLACLNSLTRSSRNFPLQVHSEILRNHPELKEIWTANESFIKMFLLRQCQINDLYFHGIFSGSLKKSATQDPSLIFKDLQQSISSGWFPFCSLINHSCAPNVERIYVEGKVALVACRPIASGSQLFDCYKLVYSLW